MKKFSQSEFSEKNVRFKTYLKTYLFVRTFFKLEWEPTKHEEKQSM